MVELVNALELLLVCVGKTHMRLNLSLRQLVLVVYQDSCPVNHEEKPQVPIVEEIQRDFIHPSRQIRYFPCNVLQENRVPNCATLIIFNVLKVLVDLIGKVVLEIPKNYIVC